MTRVIANGLSFAYSRRAEVLANLSFSFSVASNSPHGSVVALMGPSGGGKSTLLRLIAGLEKPAGGTLTIEPTPDFVPYLAQDAIILSQYSRRENARYRSFAGRFVSRFREETFRDIQSALGIDDAFLDEGRPIRPMSGGQRQRVALLRDMSVAPDLLLLDEPCVGLDQPVKIEFLQQVRRIVASRRLLVVYVTHHWDEVQMVADEVAFLEPPTSSGPQRLSVDPVARALAAPPSLLAATLISHPVCNVVECEVGLDGTLMPLPWRANATGSPRCVHIAFGLQSACLDGKGGDGCVVAQTPLVTYVRLGKQGPTLAIRGQGAEASSRVHIEGPVWLFDDPSGPARAGHVSLCSQESQTCLRFHPS